MRTPELNKELQQTIRNHFSDRSRWQTIANSLGVTLKSVRYQLNPDLGREVTYHFVGLLAVQFPAAWEAIQEEYFSE